MEKTYLPYDQDQLLLLPPSVREWVKPGDLAHLIDDVVECLDLSAIEAVYEAELRGAAALPPGDDDQGLALCINGRRGKLSRFTVDTYVRNVNLFLGWCRREGVIGDVRADRWRPQRGAASCA